MTDEQFFRFLLKQPYCSLYSDVMKDFVVKVPYMVIKNYEYIFKTHLTCSQMVNRYIPYFDALLIARELRQLDGLICVSPVILSLETLEYYDR